MDPQKLNTPHYERIFIGILVGLLLGGGGGYYAGWMIGQTQGITAATESMQQFIPTPKPSAHVQTQTATNPLQDVKTNPLDGVKLNPFE